MPQYNGVWTLEAQAQALTKQQWVTDPNFKNTTLLLQADGAANTAQNNLFLDSSPNQFAITRNGNTTQGSFSPFSQAPGYWSAYCAGSGYNPIYVDAGTACAYGTGDFTIELFFYSVGTTSANQIIFDQRPTATNGLYPVIYLNNASGKLVYQTNSADRITADNPFSFNVWTHIVVSRVSGTTRMFINGTQQTTTYADTNSYLNGASRPILGHGFANNSAYPNGYYSNVRVLKGTGVTSVTVPTSKLENIANTSLLICQSNRFVDNSTANSGSGFTVLTSGTPSVQAFGPFAPALQWTSDVVGGSGYFDGTGDYLQTPTSTNLNLSTGDFTIEAWIYRTSAATSDGVFNSVAATGSNSGLSFYVGTDSKLYLDNGVTGTTGYGVVGGNQWNHVAVIRTSNNAYLYVNGVCVNPANPITQSPNTGGIGLVGCAGITTQQLFDGYISNLRVIKGQALVTGGNNFTPPTAPVTSNTIGWTGVNVAASLTGTVQFLLNFTNAGIYDGKMVNNLETVGNAQVSTTVVNYGSGSMYFDGSGDYLQAPASNLYDFGSGDFTIECWTKGNPSATTAGALLVGVVTTGGATNTNWALFKDAPTQGYVIFYASDGTTYQVNGIGGAATLNDKNWHHVAVTRANSVFRVFVDGIQTGTTATWTGAISSTARPLKVGYNGSSEYLNGYLDDVRITKGVARYIANFTPPQQALPRQ